MILASSCILSLERDRRRIATIDHEKAGLGNSPQERQETEIRLLNVPC